MKYFAAVILLVALCCVGCTNHYFSRGLYCDQPVSGVTSLTVAAPPAHESARPGKRAPYGQFVVSASLGHMYPAADPVESEHHINLRGTKLTEVGATYLFPPRAGSQSSKSYLGRTGLELRVEEYHPFLSRRTLDYGTLHVRSAIVAIKAYSLPRKDKPLGFHYEMGVGLGNTRFSHDPDYDQYLTDIGASAIIKTGDAHIVQFGAGLDLFFVPETFCLSLNLRYKIIKVPVDWNENSPNLGTVKWFDISHTDMSVGFNFFF